METPSRHSFTLDGAVRVFPIPSPIKGDNYCRLEVDGNVVNDRTKYDIVNNSIVFLDVADVPSGSQLDVLVVQSEEAIGQLAITTNIDIVASNIANVNIVGDDIANVNTVATNITDVNTVATSIADVNRVEDSIDNIDRVHTSIAKVDRVYTSIDNVDRVHTSIDNIDRVDLSIDKVDRVYTSIDNVDTVEASIANVDTTAGSIANVNTVATDIANVNTTASNIADVTTVANDLNEPVSEIETVAGSIANVNTVGTNIANVNTTAGNIANVNTVAGINTDVTTVSGISANVTTVAGIDANVTTVAGISSDVTAVANISSDIQQVQDQLTAVQTVASDLNETVSEIDTVALSISDVNTVGAAIANVNTVATDIANVNTVAGNTANIDTVAGNTANITAVAGNNADITTVATNIADVNNYADTYSSGATEPTTPTVGDLWFDTNTQTMKVYTTGGWQNAGSSVNGTSARNIYTATEGQTTFSMTYDAGYVDVWLNGVKLVNGVDFTATDGSNIVLTAGATAGDSVDIIAYGTFNLAAPSAQQFQFTGGVGTQGTMSWNADEETVDLVQNGAVLQLGQEVQVHARNNTASTIPNGTVVMATGTLGASGRVTVAPYTLNTPIKYVIGITTEDILAGEDGKVTDFGKVRNLSTIGWNDGDVLFVADNGAMTNVEPASGLVNAIAFVIHGNSSNGTIMVRFVPLDEAGLGGAINDVFYENSTTIDVNYTITSGKNAGTFGPVTIADGVTVTIPDGSTWTVI